MKYLQISPVIYACSTFQDFVDEFSVNPDDLVLTNRLIYEPLLADCDPGCPVIYQEDYGSGEPSDTMVANILKDADRIPFQRLIALGGGAILDIAKIICLKRTASIDELYENPASIKKSKTLIALPTTAGTGSEITSISVMIRTKSAMKVGIVSPELFPDAAVLIPQLLDTVPFETFCNTSIDALIHAIESFLSINHTPYTDLFAKQAIEIIVKAFRAINAKGEEERHAWSQESMMASNFAGIAFGTAGCSAVHAMAFAFGGKYHVPHGEACYQFLIAVLKKFREKQPVGRIADLDNLLAACCDVKEDGIGALEEILETIEPLKKMSAYGAVEEDIPAFARFTVENQQRLLKNNYAFLSEEDLANLFASRL